MVEQIQQQLLDHLSDNGFPFATVQLDSIVLMNGGEERENNSRQISGVLVVNKGLAYKVDSLVLKGSASISENFLHRYLDLPRGSNYDRSRFENISLRLRELPFLQESQPWQLRFGGNGAIVVPGTGIEPVCPDERAADFKSAASACFAIRAGGVDRAGL